MTAFTREPYYRAQLAKVHHLGFVAHADACARGILELLDDVRRKDGLVLELGCGTGALTRHLVDAGLRVVATDASPAMLELAEQHVPGAEDIRPLVLPDDPLPEADAVVSVGHVLNYLPDDDSIRWALVKIAAALRPGGTLLLDLCDLRWGEVRRGQPTFALVEDDWALFTRYDVPDKRLFVREITTFVRQPEGGWYRDDERHENVLVDTTAVAPLLDRNGVDASVGTAFGHHRLPDGLAAVIGTAR